MTMLVIETGFAELSVALIDAGEVTAEHHESVGRGHAERLIPVVAALLAGHAPPDSILVDAGPGSYTGLRIGIAAARALGLAWAIDVDATTSTALVAAGAFARHPELNAVTAVLDAGRGQVYLETIAADWRDGGGPRVATPRDAAAGLSPRTVLTGSGAILLRDLGDFTLVAGDHPHAADARWLPPSHRRERPSPRYIEPTAFVQNNPEPGAPPSR